MGIRSKFLGLIAVIGMILATVSLLGYYNGQKYLTQSIAQKMDTIVSFEAERVDNWLLRKAQNVVTVAGTLGHLDAATGARREMLSYMESDKDLLNFYNGTQAGLFVQWGESEVPPGFDPRSRGWYKQAAATGDIVFTDAYVDLLTGKQVVTAALAYKNAAGQVQGVVGEDIALDVLKQQVERIKLDGAGAGFILDQAGTIVAHEDAAQVGKKLGELAQFKAAAQEIMAKDNGVFAYDENGEAMLLAYARVAHTGWVVGMELPTSVVYGELGSMRRDYAVLTLVGIAIMLALCLWFSGKITRQVLALTAHADELARGNLALGRLDIRSRDEIGKLGAAFNAMSENLRNLIRQMTASSAQVTMTMWKG